MTIIKDYSELNPAWGDRRPVIIGFLCNWCSYRAADLAGTSRYGYPATLRDIRIMCTGRLDPTFVVKALREGADGVLVMGCHPKQCHYEAGNYKALRRIALLQRTLTALGVHPDRVQIAWASAAQGNIFTQTVFEMSKTIGYLGPLEWQDTVSDLMPHPQAPVEEVVHA